jgi:hypothetical protein
MLKKNQIFGTSRVDQVIGSNISLCQFSANLSILFQGKGTNLRSY